MFVKLTFPIFKNENSFYLFLNKQNKIYLVKLKQSKNNCFLNNIHSKNYKNK